ncbi:hypothetical protein MAP00_006772 [Monascus purpureus]|nr:hypothetical protein MAP00_006772 [Monascus purpureus]
MYQHSSTRTSVDRQEVNRVLQLKRKQREARACYPCRQRKVKCDNGHPCRTCSKRGHPEICTYDIGSPSHGRQSSLERSRSVRSKQVSRDIGSPGLNDTSSGLIAGPERNPTTATSVTGNVHSLQSRVLGSAQSGVVNSPEETTAATDEGSKDYPSVYSGDNSVVSLLRSRAQDPNESMAREARSVLGLQNTCCSYPFMDLRTKQDRWMALLKVLPQKEEVSRYFHFYRIRAYPFNPILVDMDHFESELCTYLNAYSAGELRDQKRISERWNSGKAVGYISLLLAILATGVHFSDVENPTRSELCQDLARRCFQALRLSNFLFRPSLDTIQALLILGNTLQNSGQSDAAWALLGTTVRLAQTLGLHTERSVSHWPDSLKPKAKSLWLNIAWQDCLLSLCYDRPCIVSLSGWMLDAEFASRWDLSYTDIMHYLCRYGLEITKEKSPGENETSDAIDALRSLDNIYGRAQRHLQDRGNCRTLQQHLEHLALRMHFSFAVSVFCRPAIRKSQSVLLNPHGDILRKRAREGLINASAAFLDFQALSIVPLRTWSMIHTALSSTLLLCLWEETRNDPECWNLQHQVIEAFTAAGLGAGINASASSDDTLWLSERHIRTLVALRNAVSSVPLDANATSGVAHASNKDAHEGRANSAVEFRQDTFPPTFEYGPEHVSFIDAFNQNNLSPVTYLDWIMNVPSFDFTVEDQFP